MEVVFKPVTQRFTRTTALPNLAFSLATLIGTFAGPQWLAFWGCIGLFTVTSWTVYAAWRAGHDPFPDLRDRPEGYEGPTLPKS